LFALVYKTDLLKSGLLLAPFPLRWLRQWFIKVYFLFNVSSTHFTTTIISLLQAFIGRSTVDAGATLKLQMLSFANPSGRDYGGACCDLFCWSACDSIFRFSLDVGNR